MKDSIKYLNKNNIDWFPISIQNKKPNYSEVYKNIYCKKIYEDIDCLELVNEYANKKMLEQKEEKDSTKFKTQENFKSSALMSSQFMLSNSILIKKSQQIYIEEKLYNKNFIITIDTKNTIQLDIDIEDETQYNKLDNDGKKMYDRLKKEFPYYESLSKDYGFHLLLSEKDDKKLSKKLKNCLSTKSVISDYNDWKNDTECKQLNKQYGWIEIMCGKPIWCNTEFKNINKKLGGEKASDILKTILQTTFIEKNKPKTKQEIKNSLSTSCIEPPSPISNNLNKTVSDTNYNEIIEYINNIKPSSFDSYSTFLRIVFAVCRDKEDRYKQVLYDIGFNSCKSQSNYEEWFNKLYNDGKIKSTFKTPYCIITLSKDSNLDKHYQIYNKYNSKASINIFTPEELSTIFYENNEDNFMVCKSEEAGEAPEVYYYNNTDFTWSNEDKNKHKIIKRNIYLDLNKFLLNKQQELQNLIDNCEEKEEKNRYENKLNMITTRIIELGSPDIRNKICECLIQKINTENQVELKFDMNGFILPFKDCVYDLKQNTIREYVKTDYVLTKIPYEYREPCDDNYIEVKNFLLSLFPCDLVFTKIDTSTPEGKFRNIYRKIKMFKNYGVKNLSKWNGFEIEIIPRDDYWDLIYTMAYGLIGKSLPYIHIYNGEGCNGKSVIGDIMKKLLGSNKLFCGMKGNNLCDAMESNSPAPAWANCDLKRYVVFQEPTENKELCVATLKYITENTIEARKLFSNKTSVDIMAVWILMCNVRPELDGVSNNALERRIKDIHFPHNFSNTLEEFKNGTNIKYGKNDRIKKITFRFMGRKNIKYADSDFQDEARYSLLKYLLGFIKSFEKNYGKPIYEYDWKYSKLVNDRSSEYLGGSDRITDFLDTNLNKHLITDSDKVDKKKYVLLSDIHNAFVERSEFYKNASIKVKEKYKKNKFYHLISQSKIYYPYYREQKEVKMNGERKNLGSVLEGYTLRTLEDLKIDKTEKCNISDSEDEESEVEEEDLEEIIDEEYDSDSD